jgi:hypothetical protein
MDTLPAPWAAREPHKIQGICPTCSRSVVVTHRLADFIAPGRCFHWKLQHLRLHQHARLVHGIAIAIGYCRCTFAVAVFRHALMLRSVFRALPASCSASMMACTCGVVSLAISTRPMRRRCGRLIAVDGFKIRYHHIPIAVPIWACSTWLLPVWSTHHRLTSPLPPGTAAPLFIESDRRISSSSGITL